VADRNVTDIYGICLEDKM